MESCEDATPSSALEGQWAEGERRWKADAGEMNKAEDGSECSESGCRRDLEKPGMNKRACAETGRHPQPSAGQTDAEHSVRQTGQ